MKKIILITTLALSFLGCRDSALAQYEALGKPSKIELLNCDGTITHSWISTGKVATEPNSDGYYFNDAKTNKLVRVSGNVVISVYQPKELIIN